MKKTVEAVETDDRQEHGNSPSDYITIGAGKRDVKKGRTYTALCYGVRH